MIERTFVMIKPDGVKRAIVGDVIHRFEKAGLKLIGLKMVHVDEDFAKQHYTEDITIRRGEKVRDHLVKFLNEGPVVGMVWEGISAIEVVRKMVGATEPRTAQPGTIRGDYAHVSYKYADEKNIPIRNVIHASADAKDAENEVRLWFSVEELFQYENVHDKHIL
ncbi:MAG: nucleoside-diphosphate kinase [Nanoarchaeota archaeon]|nr:nucleoside-diphosphate kinase [Nanoarchaeota archaeon]